jgi:hypothetical protein
VSWLGARARATIHIVITVAFLGGVVTVAAIGSWGWWLVKWVSATANIFVFDYVEVDRLFRRNAVVKETASLRRLDIFVAQNINIHLDRAIRLNLPIDTSFTFLN